MANETEIHPSIVKMILSGQSPLTTKKIAVLANALGIEPGHLCKMVVQAYLPGLWETMDDCFGVEAAIAAQK